MYKRNLKATEVVRDLAFPPGPAGVAFKINSIFKREKRCEERVREDARKRGEQTAKERGEYRAAKKKVGGCDRTEKIVRRERERKRVYQLPCALTRCKYNNKHVIK